MTGSRPGDQVDPSLINLETAVVKERAAGVLAEHHQIEVDEARWLLFVLAGYRGLSPNVMAAQVPDLIDAVIVKKHEALQHPDMLELYRVVNDALDWPEDDPRITDVVDILERIMVAAVQAGEAGAYGLDDDLVHLMDAAVLDFSPGAERIMALLEDRGWKGWTRIERIPADRLDQLGRPTSAAPAEELDRAVDDQQGEGPGTGEHPALGRRPAAAQ